MFKNVVYTKITITEIKTMHTMYLERQYRQLNKHIYLICRALLQSQGHIHKPETKGLPFQNIIHTLQEEKDNKDKHEMSKKKPVQEMR